VLAAVFTVALYTLTMTTDVRYSLETMVLFVAALIQSPVTNDSLTETADAACGGNPWASSFTDTFRYLDEQVYRYNKRGLAHDGERFELALSQIAGKRLTFAEVTGKVGAAACN